MIYTTMVVYTPNNDFECLNAIASNPDCVLYFTATWCGPCQRIAPTIASLPTTVIKIDLDKCREMASTYGVNSVPTLIKIRGKRVMSQHVGANLNQSLLQNLCS